MSTETLQRIASVTIDDKTIGRVNANTDHERNIAIFDLVEQNSFAPAGHANGPYAVHVSVVDQRLVFDVKTIDGNAVCTEFLSLTPLRKILRDYYMVCDTYYAAIRTHTPAQIEAIDMGRRGLHNEAAQMIQDKLASAVTIDFQTARQLFTLITALFAKN